MTKPAYKCWTKATTAESGSPRRSFNWVAAGRAWFKVFSDRVECGDWTILFSDVIQATVYRARQGLIPVPILELETRNGTFQFGFNPWARPFGYLPFELREEHVRLKLSPFSLIVRVILVLLLLYWIWQKTWGP